VEEDILGRPIEQVEYVAPLDELPYRKKKRRKRDWEVGFGGARWAEKEVGHMAGWAAFLLIPFFFWKLLLLFLQHSLERRRGGFGKICKQVIKLDFDLKRFFKVCKY
jgi:hypothetical protein